PEGPQWQYEIKLDGYRTIAAKSNGKAALFSRRGHRVNTRFRAIASALEAVPDGTVLDGETVVLDKSGRPDFNRLQNVRPGDPLYFYAFDLLAVRGKTLLHEPLSVRRELLTKVMNALDDPIRISPTFDLPAEKMVALVRKNNLE